MDSAVRDMSCVGHIVRHCRNIASDRARFGDSLEAFRLDESYQRSVVLSLTQIGEMCAALTEGFRESHGGAPWVRLRRMRNFMVHEYEKIDYENVWDTVIFDIPAVQAACEKILEAEEDGD